jgi:hypothetical protein
MANTARALFVAENIEERNGKGQQKKPLESIKGF